MDRSAGRARVGLAFAMLVTLALCCAGTPAERTLVVTATAYNSLPGQTSGDPAVAAWGDRLEPGMRAIAVSRDLIELGLGHGSAVRIDGLPGRYRVLDKTASRWKRRIDIYMGVDRDAALAWGKREVRIRWVPARP